MNNAKKDFRKTLSKKVSGFTLLELMIVVGVIAILAAIILVSLGGSRAKGNDAAVKTNLNTARGESEIFAANNGGSFLPAGGSTFTIATCSAYNAAGTNMLSKDKSIASAIAEAVKRGGNGSSCYNSSNSWAVAVGLNTSSTSSWCVDSGGASKLVASAPDSAINTVTFACN